MVFLKALNTSEHMEQPILGLSLNTRRLGLAILSGNHLIDFHLQVRTEAWTPQKKALLRASVQSKCEQHNIKNIALLVPYDNQISTQTKELIESLKEHFHKNNISLF